MKNRKSTKKILLPAVTAIALAFCMAITAMADLVPALNEYHVTFKPNEKMESNFKTSDMYNQFAGMQPGDYTIGIKGAYLIKTDGTEVEGKIGNFHGCNIEVQVLTGISTVVRNDATTSSPLYNLQGQRIQKPQRGIYIRNGKKYLIN
jgi:hypothetical protein